MFRLPRTGRQTVVIRVSGKCKFCPRRRDVACNGGAYLAVSIFLMDLPASTVAENLQTRTIARLFTTGRVAREMQRNFRRSSQASLLI